LTTIKKENDMKKTIEILAPHWKDSYSKIDWYNPIKVEPEEVE